MSPLTLWMTDPTFWVMLGASPGFFIGFCTGALATSWQRQGRAKPQA
jgi:hypothetical protein